MTARDAAPRRLLVPIKIFFSSPGDLFPERTVAKAVVTQEIANYPHLKGEYAFLTYAYEDIVPPILGEEPQLTIDRYLLKPQDADIVVCLLWQRMGTPTRSLIDPQTNQPYQSGTEYELLTAYRHRRPDGTPHILLYHCERPATDPRLQDAEQQAQVAALLARFRPDGDLLGLVQSFTDATDLRNKLRMGLLQIIERNLKPVLEAQLAAGRRERTRVFLFDGPLTSQYVSRPEAEDLLRRTLLGSRKQVGIVAETALHGMGGLGKTVLARAVCEDPTVQGAFPDGILWATLGQQARPLEQQRRWIAALRGDIQIATSEQLARDELQRLLRDRAMLLVIDDVWNEVDAHALRVGGPKCRVLLTTRNSETTRDAQVIRLDVMRREESRAVLQQASGGMVDAALAERIAERVGDLPLALTLVAGQLRAKVRWETIAASLTCHDLRLGSAQPYQSHQSQNTQKTVLSVIGSSIDALPAADRARYLELVIFPEDVSLDLTAVARLWGRPLDFPRWLAEAPPQPFPPDESEYLLGRLRTRSLLQADDSLHDLQVEYLHSAVPAGEQVALHSALVSSYGQAATWPMLSKDEVYAWRWLAWHLQQAQRNAELIQLVTDSRYLERKIAMFGTEAAALDVELAGEGLEPFAAALRLSAHALNSDPSQLHNQLTGRMGRASLLHDADISASGPRLRLATPTLTAPGQSLIRTLVGHSNDIQGCAFSPDGCLLASASADRTVRLWDVTTGQEVWRFEGHTDWVYGCAFSPDGQLLASCSGDRTVRLWDVTTGQELCRLSDHTDWVKGCAFSPDGCLLASASGSSIVLWEVATRRKLRQLEGDVFWAEGCTFSADGQLLACPSENGVVHLWKVATGEQLGQFAGHTDQVNGCAFSPDGCLLASASADRTVRLWDVTTGQEVWRFEGHTDWVYGCAFSPDGQLLASAAGDQTLRLWRAAPSQEQHRRLDSHTDSVNGCAFSQDGYLLATATGSSVVLWEAGTGHELLRLDGPTERVASCTLSPDGRMLASGVGDGRIWLWEVATGRVLRCLEGHTDWVNGCAFSPNGWLLASASNDRTLRLWNIATGKVKRSLELDWTNPRGITQGHTHWVNACAFSPDGRLVASASTDETARLWEVATGRELCRLEGHVSKDIAEPTLSDKPGAVLGCAFSPDGHVLATASEDHTVRLWEIETGREFRCLKGHTEAVTSCAFSPDGGLLVSVSADRTVRLWATATGQEVDCCYLDAAVCCCAWHPQDPLIAAGDGLGRLHRLHVEGIDSRAGKAQHANGISDPS